MAGEQEHLVDTCVDPTLGHAATVATANHPTASAPRAARLRDFRSRAQASISQGPHITRTPNQKSAVDQLDRHAWSVTARTIHHSGRTPTVAAAIGQRMDRGPLPEGDVRDEFTIGTPSRL